MLARRSRRIAVVCLAALLVAGPTVSAILAQRQVAVSVQAREKPAPNVPANSAYAMPNNIYGAHLLVDDGMPGTRGYQQLQWVRKLVGRWGYAKTLFMNIDKRTREPKQGWVDYVNRCYAVELIPLIRLAGYMKDGQWVAPEPDAPGDYSSMAAAVKRVVQGLPRSELCPLYIEVWNEPNLPVEWTGKPDPKEYADFFVQTAEAIRSIGDERIRILNGGLATSAEWVEKLCRANPKFISSFDVWASHPYPHGHPPRINFHDKTAPPRTDLTIDSYLLELEVLKRMGRPDVKVMLTETGYSLGTSTHVKAGYPIIDEFNRADYMVRAFRDYWPKWPEVLAVFPFEFSNENWERYNWVRPESGTAEDGTPTLAHYQYTAVAALAKPTDATGAISGTITVAKLGSRLEDARAVIHLKPIGSTSDVMGNYCLSNLPPGMHRMIVSKPGFATVEKKVKVAAGANTVFDVSLVAEQRATLAGTVRSGDDGEEIKGVKLTLEPGGAEATSDGRGRYEFTDCIPGRYTLMAQARGLHDYASAPFVVKLAGQNRHDFVLGRQEQRKAENLLSNAGFESGGGGGAKPGVALGFEPMTPAPSEFRDAFAQISEQLAHTGRCSQEIQMRPEETAVRQITHYGTARVGTQYVAGAWVRVVSTDEDATAWISLDATRNDGSVIKKTQSKPAMGRSGEWVWLEVRSTAPAGSERISVGLHTKGGKGSAHFDDVYLGAMP